MPALPKLLNLTIMSSLPSGWTIKKYSEEVLGLKLATFYYRSRKGVLHLEDYHKILATTGKTWEELFGIAPSVVQSPVPLRHQSAHRIKDALNPQPPVAPVPIPDHEAAPTEPPKKEEAKASLKFVLEEIDIPFVDS